MQKAHTSSYDDKIRTIRMGVLIVKKAAAALEQVSSANRSIQLDFYE